VDAEGLDKDKKIVSMVQQLIKDKILQPPVNEVESYVKRPFGHFFINTLSNQYLILEDQKLFKIN